jgi:hypothetical protein
VVDKKSNTVNEIRGIENGLELVEFVEAYFSKGSRVINERENHNYLTEVATRMQTIEMQDSETALKLINLLLDNLSQFERSSESRDAYQVKLECPQQAFSLLSQNELETLLDKIISLPYQRHLKYNNYGTLYSSIYSAWLKSGTDLKLSEVLNSISYNILTINHRLKHKQRK